MCVCGLSAAHLSQCEPQGDVAASEGIYVWAARARAARSIFGHFSSRMHLGRRYKFSQAGMIVRVSSLSFFSYYQFRILCSPLRPPSCSTAGTFVNKRQIACKRQTARTHVNLQVLMFSKQVTMQPCGTSGAGVQTNAPLFLTSGDVGINVGMTWKASKRLSALWYSADALHLSPQAPPLLPLSRPVECLVF